MQALRNLWVGLLVVWIAGCGGAGDSKDGKDAKSKTAKKDGKDPKAKKDDKKADAKKEDAKTTKAGDVKAPEADAKADAEAKADATPAAPVKLAALSLEDANLEASLQAPEGAKAADEFGAVVVSAGESLSMKGMSL